MATAMRVRSRVDPGRAPAPNARRHLDRIAVAFGWAALAAFVYLVYRVVDPFLIPLAWAAVLAIVVSPLYRRLDRRWGSARAAAFSTLAMALAVVVPVLLVLTVFVQQAIDTAAAVQGATMEGRIAGIARVWAELAARIPVLQRVDVIGSADDMARRAATFLVTQSGLILRDAAVFMFQIVVALLSTFFVLRDSSSIVAGLRRVLPMHAEAREALMGRTVELVSVSVASALVVAAVQGLLGGLAFWAVGIDAPVFWGVMMGILCLLPFGAWVIWLPAAVALAADGAIARALILAALGLTTVSAADNVLRPMLLSGRSHLHGLVVLVGLIGGVGVFGPLGLVLGPILVATAVALLKEYIDAPARDVWRA